MSGNKVCTIYLVRHGESEANVNKSVQGHTDSPLTEKGKEDARKIRDILSHVPFSAVYSSDLERARLTAEIIADGKNLRVETREALREKNFGEFEGKSHAEYVRELKEEFYKFDNELSTEERWNHKAHPSMESDRELLKRVSKEVKNIVDNNPGGAVLIVSHRYAIRMFLLSLGVGKHENLKAGALRTGGYVVLESDGASFFLKEVVGAEDQGSLYSL